MNGRFALNGILIGTATSALIVWLDASWGWLAAAFATWIVRGASIYTPRRRPEAAAVRDHAAPEAEVLRSPQPPG